jgi:nicotinamide-nucleotide amidase
MLAEIIAVGSEMLTPHRQDTNSLYLTAGLNDLGVTVAFKTIVGDNRQHLTAAIRIALQRADILILSGGLGPTEDDLTRECTAEALSLTLHQNPDVLEGLRRRFAARNMPMPPNNMRQADVLSGAELLPNANGSAPGQYLDIDLPLPQKPGAPSFAPLAKGGVSSEARPSSSPQPPRLIRKIVLLLPGPPKELKPLFDTECKPRLARALPPRHLARRVLRMALIPESTVDARTAPIYSQFTDVETTILAGHGEIQLHFLCTKPTLAAAQARVDQLTTLIQQEMGDDIFSADDRSLPEVVLNLLDLAGHTLSIAESCTGGLLAERLTAVPNSSRVFSGGLITYSNASKTTLANVPAGLLEEQGAVNSTVARLLAEGTRARLNTTLALSITGIAGPTAPTGPDAAKPIGLVYIALATPEGTGIRELKIPGDRDRVRLWATMHALELLRHHLL